MLRHFFHFLDTRGVKELGQVDGESLAAFIAKQTHLRPRTVSSHVSHLRAFFRHLCMKGLIASSLVDEIPKIRIYRDDRIPTVWSPRDVNALLAAVDRSSAGGKRDYAILMLAAKLGLRAGDIQALRLDQLNWDRSSLHLVQRKTGYALDLPMPPEVGEALMEISTEIGPGAWGNRR
jgi:integrase